MNRRTHVPRNRKDLRLEQLEPRCLLDGENLLGTEAYLTLSFAPDGADVAGRPNELAATFSALGPPSVWQDEILHAFQTWLAATNGDVGLVDDSGDPLGSPGATRGDRRFGDIRIAGVEMAPNIGAISVPITSVVSGTWHADVIFNTAFPYQSLSEVFAIALHEAGNVLGLQDNNDPNSPLNAGPIPTSLTPTAADLALLHELHGERAPDINELDDNELEANDTLIDASDLSFGEVVANLPGSAPALAYGDIQSASDIDYFELQIPSDYTGDLVVAVRTAGLSILRPALRIESAAGVTLASNSGSGVRGSEVSLTLSNVIAGQTYFVRVSGATNDLYGVGGYALVGVLSGRNVVSAADIASATNGSLREIELVDLSQIFDPAEDYFRDDAGLNDTQGNATALSSSFGFASSARYETLASIGIPGDVDYYKVTVPSTSGTSVLYVSLRSLKAGRLVPKADVFDSSETLLPSRVLVNGAGEYLLEVDVANLSGDLFIRVASADESGLFNQGNYALTASFANSPAVLTNYASGTLTSLAEQREHTLYVAEPQLIHFNLAANGDVSGAPVSIVVNVVNSAGVTVYTVASPVGQVRSAGAAFLPIGSYTIVVSARGLAGAVVTSLDYEFSGAAFSDPFVGDGSDPTTNPFACPPGSPEGFYCYPGGIISSDPFLWDNFVDTLPAPPVVSLPEAIRLLLGDWWRWVWTTSGENGPPLAVNDLFPSSTAASGVAMSNERNVLTNDIDPELDPLVSYNSTLPANGTLSLNLNGTFEYTPNPGFWGTDTFTYTAFDFSSQSSVATVVISVASPTGVSGDYDGDGAVTSADYDVWRNAFGNNGGPADGNFDGLVDAADYSVWRDNLGATAPAVATAAVSHPTNLVFGSEPVVGSSERVRAPSRRGPWQQVSALEAAARWQILAAEQHRHSVKTTTEALDHAFGQLTRVELATASLHSLRQRLGELLPRLNRR